MAVHSVAVDVVFLVVAVVGLGVGAAQFVTGAGRLARRLGIPGLVVGLTVVAFGTSAPEFAVTIDAALTAKPDISVGNVVGSNVLNLGFILGGVALVRALPSSRDLVYRDGAVLIGSTLLVAVVLWDLRVSRIEGVVLFGLLVGYLGLLVSAGSDRLGTVPEVADGAVLADLVRAVGGIAVVVVSAQLLVAVAVDIARTVGLSEWLIGITVVAAGTSTPEFATSVVAARRGRTGLSAGNLVGSCIFNSLGVLGLAAAIRPLPVAGTAIQSTLAFLVISVLATLLFWSDDVLSKPEGAVLVLANAVTWILDSLG